VLDEIMHALADDIVAWVFVIAQHFKTAQVAGCKTAVEVNGVLALWQRFPGVLHGVLMISSPTPIIDDLA